jgi:site-specific recombinase XerD
MTDSKQLTRIEFHVPAESDNAVPPPPLITQAGNASRNAWHDFFETIQNRHTRTAYEHAVRRFLEWLPSSLAPEQIRPAMVGRYIATHVGSIPTRKLHLSALRKFFDLLVERHIMLINPAACVRGQRYEAVEGKTPEITIDQARKLLAAIRFERKNDKGELVPLIVGLRDRAIIAVLFYTAVRAGAVAKLKVRHLRYDGTQYSLRFDEKGGKSRDIPVRADLEKMILAYMKAAGIDTSLGEQPLFCTAVRRTGTLTASKISNIDICRMVKRRLKDAKLPQVLSPHSFRVATITDLLSRGEALEDVQYLAGHADPRTTRLYDRRQRRITRNLVERISNLAEEVIV